MDDQLRKYVQQIPIRKGCLLIWSSLLMHGNHPNNSERFRAVQYIRQIPNSGDHPYGPMIKNKKDLLPKDLTLTPLGSRLFGLVPWGNDLRKQTEWMNVVEPWKGNKNQVNQKQ